MLGVMVTANRIFSFVRLLVNGSIWREISSVNRKEAELCRILQ